ADGVDSEPAFLRANIGSEVELSRRVAVDMAIQARYSEAWCGRLAVVSGIELLLRKWRYQQPQAVQLHRRQNIFEESVIVVDRDDFSPRDVAQLRPIRQEDRRWKFRKKCVGNIEFDIEAL